MTKNDTVRELAGIMVNNWIVTGDQPEAKRAQLIASQASSLRTMNMKTLGNMLANITQL